MHLHAACSSWGTGCACKHRLCDELEAAWCTTTCLHEDCCKHAKLPNHQALAIPYMYYGRASQDALTCQSFMPAIAADLDKLLGTTVACISCSLPFLPPGPRMRHCRLCCGSHRMLLC